jgi:nucleoside-diphosphate-sugar epimerase
MSTYLVTGNAGFIASRVTELLLDDGHRVVGIDNLNDAYDVRLKQWRLARLEGRDGFEMNRADISDRASLDEVWRRHDGKFDAVINLAARAGVRQARENPWVYVDTNITGTLNLLEQCKDHGVKKFVLASTSSLYGKHNKQPYTEDANTDKALSAYAASKKGAEAMAYTYHHLYGLDVTVNRYFTVYGPAGRPDMSLFRFTQWIFEDRPVTIFGDGSQSRDFTYVDDIARGTIAAASREVGYEIINLGSDQPHGLMEVVHHIEKRAGKKAQLVHKPSFAEDVPSSWADITKARKLLDWEPRTFLEEGLDRLIDWYLENRDWAKDVVTT